MAPDALQEAPEALAVWGARGRWRGWAGPWRGFEAFADGDALAIVECVADLLICVVGGKRPQRGWRLRVRFGGVLSA